MRVAVFYMSLKDGDNRHPVHISDSDGVTLVYIRAEEVDVSLEDIDDALTVALDQAEPRGDESVMNSHIIGE